MLEFMHKLTLQQEQSIYQQQQHAQKLEQQAQKQEQTNLLLFSQMGGFHPTPNVTQIGIAAETALLNSVASCNFSGYPGERPVFSANDVKLASECESEKNFDIYITSFLSSLFPSFAVINSEDFAWLRVKVDAESSPLDAKPDFFIAPTECYEKKILKCDSKSATEREEMRKRYTQEKNVSFRFGILADWRLRDSVYILESKFVALGNAEFGEIIVYLQKLGGMKRARGMLFNQTDFWLVEVQGPAVTQRIKAKWSDPGSIRRIQEFFPQGPWHGVSELCKMLKVRIADPLYFQSKDTAFLGAGGIGRVFRVIPESIDLKNARLSDMIALKVVPILEAVSLNLEFARLKYHHLNCPECTLLAKPLCDEIVVSSELAGYILTPVGLSLRYDVLWKNKGDWLKRVINALLLLHVHGIAHGDPRLPNVIVNLDSLVWIDVVGAHFNPENAMERAILFKNDMQLLLKSILHSTTLSPTLLAAVSNYNPDESHSCDEIVQLCLQGL